MNVDTSELAESSIDELTGQLTARARAVNMAHAAMLETVVAVADRDPVGLDADLVAFTLKWTQTAARGEVEFGRHLQRVLKPVWAAMCRGDLDVRRARVFCDVLCTVNDQIAFAIALDHADRAHEWTIAQLRDRLRRAMLRADPDGAARRTERSIEQRKLTMMPDRESTAGLIGTCLPAARAVAAFERVDAFACARHNGGDARTLDQLRADTFLDLLEGVDIGASPVHRRGIVELSVPWSVLARGIGPTATEPAGGPNPVQPNAHRGDEPATLAGFGPVEAPVARDIVAAMLGRRDIAWRFRVNGDAGELLAVGSVQRVVTRPPREADPHRRSPGPALARWVRARDGTCRAPGCRVPATVCDIDHTIGHASGGRTTHDNLALLCRHHHRLKHEPGWQVAQPAPGVLTWTSRHGPSFTRRDGP
ncbi:MAG TPA: DUF222 domain-containing protein [Micromonosporaceae bacterium]|jgi:hypothetical protein|nr:DUF222 domain-containing protein [Micromonosporaceae bacterium]